MGETKNGLDLFPLNISNKIKAVICGVCVCVHLKEARGRRATIPASLGHQGKLVAAGSRDPPVGGEDCAGPTTPPAGGGRETGKATPPP